MWRVFACDVEAGAKSVAGVRKRECLERQVTYLARELAVGVLVGILGGRGVVEDRHGLLDRPVVVGRGKLVEYGEEGDGIVVDLPCGAVGRAASDPYPLARADVLGELAEHICSGERIWIARGTADGTTWQIDDDPVTLFTVLDQLPAAHYHWAIEQTMAVLDDAAPAEDADEDPDRELPREIRHLTFETLALAHAGDALGARLNVTREDTPHGLALHDHAIMRVA